VRERKKGEWKERREEERKGKEGRTEERKKKRKEKVRRASGVKPREGGSSVTH